MHPPPLAEIDAATLAWIAGGSEGGVNEYRTPGGLREYRYVTPKSEDIFRACQRFNASRWSFQWKLDCLADFRKRTRPFVILDAQGRRAWDI